MVILLSLLGCNDCGDYSYKGVRGVEWCGTVYGTDGYWYDVQDDPIDGEGVYELVFEHDVPPGEFTFTHSATASVLALVEDLETGEVLGPEDVISTCSWWDYRDPLDDGDDIEYLEPATELELELLGSRPQAGWGGEEVTRRFRWHVVCGDNVLTSTAEDNVGMVPMGLHARYAELAGL